MLKEHGCSPVVATPVRSYQQDIARAIIPEVFGECACSAGSYGRWIFLHSRVECIASNDLVNVRRDLAWRDESKELLEVHKSTRRE